MPSDLVVRCPACEGRANFHFAHATTIKRNADLDWFENAKEFFVARVYDNGYKNLAFYFPRLKGRRLDLIEDFPPDYSAKCWLPDYTPPVHWGFGTMVCSNCDLRRKHSLEWPSDAFHQISHKGSTLWAFDDVSLSCLIEFISSNERDHGWQPYTGFLKHIPKKFLLAKNRAEIIKKLSALQIGNTI